MTMYKKNSIEPKQVIVVRRDLGMSPGKLAAQVAHASMGAVLKAFKIDNLSLKTDLSQDLALDIWINNSFTKVVLGVDSHAELMAIYDKAKKNCNYVKLIIDEGRTEFKNQTTATCIGIGPMYGNLFDGITDHLHLY